MKKNIERILVVTIGGLGDAVLFSPILIALRKSYPNSRIELLVANLLAKEVYKSADGVSHVTFVNCNKLTLISKTTSLIPFLITSYLKGRYNIGFFASGLNPQMGSLLRCTGIVKDIVYAPKANGHLTDLDCNVMLSQTIDKNINKKDVFIPINTKSRVEAKTILKEHEILLDNEKLLAVYPSIELVHRPRWELSKLIKVIQLIKNDGFNGKTVLVGSQSEGEEWEAIDKENIVDANLAGKLSILGSASLLSKCFLTIGNDGGLMHVAGAVGSPLVTIMANTPSSYRPPGKNVKIIHSKHTCCNGLYPNRPKDCKNTKCVEDITVEEVYKACLEYLSV